MRWMVVVVLMLCGPVAAAECSRGESGEALVVTGWEVTISQDGAYTSADVKLTVENKLPKGVRLIDASVRFEDALGGSISNVGLTRDVQVATGATFEDSGSYLGTRLERIPAMNRNDVVVFACTKGVVYEDGTKQTFD